MATVFAIGSNGSGQLGIGHKEDVSVPKPVIFYSESLPSSVKAVAAGGNHTLLLSGSGQLYWTGDATTGACGSISPDSVPADPVFSRFRLDGDRPVTRVAATWQASVFTRLDSQGMNTEVYSCGIGDKGELGQGQLIVRLPKATRIENFPPQDTQVVDLSGCMSHIVAVLDNGEVFGWGNGRKGQLGEPAGIINSPRKFAGVPFKVQRAVCGKDFTCLVGDPTSGELLVLGSDKWDIKAKAPSSVPGWKDVGASWGNIFVLQADGNILSWGRNDHGQLAPTDLAPVEAMAVGSEHVVALSSSQDVLVWGWGEHGNCGPLPNSEIATKTANVIASSKFLPAGAKIATIGAGCATSWVVIEGISQAQS